VGEKGLPEESAMTHADRAADPDIGKGAIEGPPNDSNAQGNRNAPALDSNGLPNDEVAIAEDVIGANEDETVGD
jgi:hypothetical protein